MNFDTSRTSRWLTWVAARCSKKRKVFCSRLRLPKWYSREPSITRWQKTNRRRRCSPWTKTLEDGCARLEREDRTGKQWRRRWREARSTICREGSLTRQPHRSSLHDRNSFRNIITFKNLCNWINVNFHLFLSASLAASASYLSTLSM